MYHAKRQDMYDPEEEEFRQPDNPGEIPEDEWPDSPPRQPTSIRNEEDDQQKRRKRA